MALIVKCRACAKRIPEKAAACPVCGGSDLRFVVDYWPRGRSGGRRQMTLPDSVRTASDARETERVFMSASRGVRKIRQEVPEKTTVEDLFPDYLVWYHLHRSAATWRDVSRAWEKDIKKLLGGYRVTEIGAEHFSLYQRLRQGRVKGRTINKELDYFSGFLRWCRREKKIPLERIEYEKLPSTRPLPMVLSFEEVARIMAAAESEPMYHALLLCLYSLGLRSAEARELRWVNVDFGNGTVKVIQKGGTWKVLPAEGPLVGALEKLQELQKTRNKGKLGEYVFSARKSGAPLQNVRKAVLRICERAEVTKKVTPHLFRHSIATHMMCAGVNLRTIQKYMGHSEISTTEFYTHVALGNLRAAQKTVGRYEKSE